MKMFDLSMIMLVTIALQEHVKKVIRLLEKINKLFLNSLHFEQFVLITYIQVIFEVFATEDTPYHIFFKNKSFWMMIRQQAW